MYFLKHFATMLWLLPVSWAISLPRNNKFGRRSGEEAMGSSGLQWAVSSTASPAILPGKDEISGIVIKSTVPANNMPTWAITLSFSISPVEHSYAVPTKDQTVSSSTMDNGWMTTSTPDKDQTSTTSIPANDMIKSKSIQAKDQTPPTTIATKDQSTSASLPAKDQSTWTVSAKDQLTSITLPAKDKTISTTLPAKNQKTSNALPAKDQSTSTIPAKDKITSKTSSSSSSTNPAKDKSSTTSTSSAITVPCRDKDKCPSSPLKDKTSMSASSTSLSVPAKNQTTSISGPAMNKTGTSSLAISTNVLAKDKTTSPPVPVENATSIASVSSTTPILEKGQTVTVEFTSMLPVSKTKNSSGSPPKVKCSAPFHNATTPTLTASPKFTTIIMTTEAVVVYTVQTITQNPTTGSGYVAVEFTRTIITTITSVVPCMSEIMSANLTSTIPSNSEISTSAVASQPAVAESGTTSVEVLTLTLGSKISSQVTSLVTITRVFTLGAGSKSTALPLIASPIPATTLFEAPTVLNTPSMSLSEDSQLLQSIGIPTSNLSLSNLAFSSPSSIYIFASSPSVSSPSEKPLESSTNTETNPPALSAAASTSTPVASVTETHLTESLITAPLSGSGSFNTMLSTLVPVYAPSMLGNAYGGGYIVTPSIYVVVTPSVVAGVPPGYGFSVDTEGSTVQASMPATTPLSAITIVGGTAVASPSNTSPLPNTATIPASLMFTAIITLPSNIVTAPSLSISTPFETNSVTSPANPNETSSSLPLPMATGFGGSPGGGVSSSASKPGNSTFAAPSQTTSPVVFRGLASNKSTTFATTILVLFGLIIFL